MRDGSSIRLREQDDSLLLTHASPRSAWGLHVAGVLAVGLAGLLYAVGDDGGSVAWLLGLGGTALAALTGHAEWLGRGIRRWLREANSLAIRTRRSDYRSAGEVTVTIDGDPRTITRVIVNLPEHESGRTTVLVEADGLVVVGRTRREEQATALAHAIAERLGLDVERRRAMVRLGVRSVLFVGLAIACEAVMWAGLSGLLPDARDSFWIVPFAMAPFALYHVLAAGPSIWMGTRDEVLYRAALDRTPAPPRDRVRVAPSPAKRAEPPEERPDIRHRGRRSVPRE